MIRTFAILIALAGFAVPLTAQELVRIVRLKISAIAEGIGPGGDRQLIFDRDPKRDG